MVLRVKSLDGLMILRPFQKEKITRRLSQDTRMEMRRLEVMRYRTILVHGNERDRKIAEAYLERSDASRAPLNRDSFPLVAGQSIEFHDLS